MSAMLELDRAHHGTGTPQLFVVQIDTNCGFMAPDWEDNTPPQSLPSALDEASTLRKTGWICRIVPAKPEDAQ